MKTPDQFAAVTADRDVLAARIDKALAEHRRIENRAFPPLHALNGEVIHEGMPAGPPSCVGCQRLWPCPTVRALADLDQPEPMDMR